MKNSKLITSIILGVVFWLNAALIVKFCGESVFSEGNPKMFLFFFLAIPVTLASMFIAKFIMKSSLDELLKPVVVMTITATLLDGIALAWFRQLYSNSFEVALNGSAWILWGAGLGLLFAYILESRKIEI
ncbi:MAG: hypothetical protein EAZ27_01330 [Cytophagales bacterium]|nr:MAG: hypothetical protein EAZ27_01330 [Cytophagales bacterium]